MGEYIDYILNSIISDVEGFNHWWMCLILPAILYFIVLMIKYSVLTMPIWLPFVIISRTFKKD